MIKSIKPPLKKQSTNSSFLKEEQCKSEITIKHKNISKLVFVESDDQNSQDEQAKAKLRQTAQSLRRNVQPDLDLRRKRPFSKQFKIDSKLLKPSLMNDQFQNIQEYEQIINCTTFQPPKSTPLSNNNKASRVVIKQQNTKFEELVERRDKLRNQKLHRRELPKSFFTQKVQPKQQDVQRKDEKKELKVQEEQVMIPKMQVANLCFQQSDQQPQGTQNIKKDFSEKDHKQAVATQKQLERETQNQIQEKAKPVQNQAFQEFQQVNEPQQAVNIVQDFQNAELCEKSMYIQQILKDLQFNEVKIIGLMHTPILAGTKQVFQVQVFSSLTQKYYLFWLDMGQKMRLLMKAVKLLQINKTTFEFYTLDPKLHQYMQTCTMTSNIDRSLFNMHIFDHRTNKKRLIGTIHSSFNIKNTKMIVLYYPKVKNNQCTIFEGYQINKDLQNVFRENQIQQVDYLMTTKMQLGKKLRLMAYYNLKVSQKSMEFKNSSGNIQVIIGKKQSKRYKIIAGPGLTPAQVFGLTIVQIQT